MCLDKRIITYLNVTEVRVAHNHFMHSQIVIAQLNFRVEYLTLWIMFSNLQAGYLVEDVSGFTLYLRANMR
jgi:hypothetical protein